MCGGIYEEEFKMKEHDSLITVKDLVEHEDGSATMVVDTTPEATRLLVEEGLLSLLEKVADESNTKYSFRERDEVHVDE